MNNGNLAFLALAATGLTAQSALLWDNNVIPNGVGARALSPPAFPNIRVVDDIVVRAPGWAVDTNPHVRHRGWGLAVGKYD